MSCLNFLFIVIALLFVAPSYQASTKESFCVTKDLGEVHLWSNNCHQNRICYKGYLLEFVYTQKTFTSNQIGSCNRGTWNLSWQIDKYMDNFLYYGGKRQIPKKDEKMAQKYGYSSCLTADIAKGGISC